MEEEEKVSYKFWPQYRRLNNVHTQYKCRPKYKRQNKKQLQGTIQNTQYNIGAGTITEDKIQPKYRSQYRRLNTVQMQATKKCSVFSCLCNLLPPSEASPSAWPPCSTGRQFRYGQEKRQLTCYQSTFLISYCLTIN